MCRIRSRVAPAPSTVTSRSRRCGSGIWAIASPSTAMWSAAVLEPALPGRSRRARASRVLSHHAHERVMPVGALERARRAFLVRVCDLDRGVHADHDRLPQIDIGDLRRRDPHHAGRCSAPRPGGGSSPARRRCAGVLVRRSLPGCATRSDRTRPGRTTLPDRVTRPGPTAPVRPRRCTPPRSVRTRPRSCTGTNPRRANARDRPPVRPVLSAISRSAADPVCDTTPCPSTSTVRPFDHALSCT